MGRFFNREAGFVALFLLVLGIVIACCLFGGAPIWQKCLIALAVPALCHWLVVPIVQTQLLDFYGDRCLYDRALKLAVCLRESALDRKTRQMHTLTVAAIQSSLGNYDAALKNLKSVIHSKDRPIAASWTDAVTGYCLTQLGKEPIRAEELIAASIRSSPDEGNFVAILAFLRLRQGKFQDALTLLEKSWELEPDPKYPNPGERPYLAALALAGLDRLDDARAQLELASKANKHSRFACLAKEALEKNNLPDLAKSILFPASEKQPDSPSEEAPAAKEETAAAPEKVEATAQAPAADEASPSA